jgi:hypothetical protein
MERRVPDGIVIDVKIVNVLIKYFNPVTYI